MAAGEDVNIAGLRRFDFLAASGAEGCGNLSR
jgi:hypothetical protein